MKPFKPMLAPSEQPDLEKIDYPILASFKLDGIRCIFKDGEMLSRSLKPIVNKQLQEHFQPLKDISKEMNIILDGELYDHTLTFQQITSLVMTQDWKSEKTIKKNGEALYINANFMFYCFDCHKEDHIMFEHRTMIVNKLEESYPKLIHAVEQEEVNDKKEVEYLFQTALKYGYEGLILKSADSKYKFGRATLNERTMYKVKPYETFDAQILEVIQGTEVREGAEKKINELGNSVTSMKKDDRVLINKASAFLVKYGDHKLKVTIAATDAERSDMWEERDIMKGKWIEYKAMMVGAKDVPRHPVMLRFREDKNGK